MYKVLIVDDERMIRMGIKKTIPWTALKIGTVLEAASGEEALQVARKECPDILISDICMTGMSGLELISKMQEYNHKIRIIVLTGYDEFEYARKCLRMGVDEFLLKPVDEQLLKTEIKKLVNILDDTVEKRRHKNRMELFKEVFEELKNVMQINIKDTGSVIRAFDSFCGAVESYNVSDGQVRRCCFNLASAIYYSYCIEYGEVSGNKIKLLLNALSNAGRKEACQYTKDFLEALLEPQNKNLNEIVNVAKRFISENIAEDISVASLAEQYYLSPAYFSRLFKRETGEGCNEYIVRMRIEKAKSLLEMTSLKTGSIAQTVGYNDTNYFSLAFKKHTGMSPTQYRRSKKGI